MTISSTGWLRGGSTQKIAVDSLNLPLHVLTIICVIESSICRRIIESRDDEN